MAQAPPIYQRAQRHLARRDPVLKPLIRQVGACTLQIQRNGFVALARSILAQQISTKAALTIHGRLLQALGNEDLTPTAVLALSEETLRSVGLSGAKQRSLRDLSEKITGGTVDLAKVADMDDEGVIEHLLPVRGIGRWTAEMFLIFSLGRLDVLPVDDLGFRAGVREWYDLASLPDKQHLMGLAEPWRPYRSIATWYFWRSRGPVPQSSEEKD